MPSLDKIPASDKAALRGMIGKDGFIDDYDAQIRALCVLSANKYSERQTAAKLGINRATVHKWRQRYRDNGLDGLKDLPRPGRAKLDRKTEAKILETTKNSLQPNEKKWTIRSLAKLCGVSPATVQRVWTRHGVKPKRP